MDILRVVLILTTRLVIGEKVQTICEYSLVQISDECPTISSVDWERYGEELYKARAMLFLQGSASSMNAVYHLLKSVTWEGFHVAFECPQAALSSFYSLAAGLAYAGRLRRAQAVLFLGFIFARDKGFYDCSPWPIRGWDMLLASRFLTERVSAIDSASVPQDIPRSLVKFGPGEIAIVSICAYGDDQPIKQLSRENHRAYAELHGYTLYHFETSEDFQDNHVANMSTRDKNPFFWKVIAVRNVLESHKWVLWMDCDAFFMEPSMTIDSILETYAEPHESSGPEEISKDLLITVDTTGLNNGVWLMRHSSWSIDFLSRWWNSDILQGAGTTHNCSDQSTMLYELLYVNTMRDLASENGEGWDRGEASIWPTEVAVVPQEYLQSFHKETAEAVLSREFQDGDFIKHHPGCHYYKKPCQILYAMAHASFAGKLTNLINNH